jgi:hypothetical protein
MMKGKEIKNNLRNAGTNIIKEEDMREKIVKENK